MDIEKLKMHRWISILITSIGVVLMVFMVLVEDEPGALPLLLIVIGTGWYFITRSRMKSQKA